MPDRNQPDRGSRLKTHVKTARKRSSSSARWLGRQLNDPYVHQAKERGYRARSVFKLEEIDKRFNLLRPGARIADLGAAPGSWSQYAHARGCHVVALDLLAIAPIAGVSFVQGNFLDQDICNHLRELAGGRLDVVLSDIAADATGSKLVDRLRAEAIGEAVIGFAVDNLKPGGACLIKLVRGAEQPIRQSARKHARRIHLIKPKATRGESSEIYLLAEDFG